MLGEDAARLFERLRNTDNVALAGAQRHAEDSLGDIASLAVDRRIEARIDIGVVDNDAPARLKGSADNAIIVEEPNLPATDALRHARIKFTCARVVEEEAATVTVERQ